MIKIGGVDQFTNYLVLNWLILLAKGSLIALVRKAGPFLLGLLWQRGLLV
jgi:hypothetical protein